jgi:GNAT superfamily N-acetyltransferase
MEKQLIVRPYRNGDEKEIFKLYKMVYSARQYDLEEWLKWWQWKYNMNPTGKSIIIIAEHNGKIVGQYPLILVNLMINDKVLKISQNVDLMVHPDYRNQGIFSKLEKAAIEEARKSEIFITIGFPNSSAHHGHIKSGWFDIGINQLWCMPLNWRNAIDMKIKNKFLSAMSTLGATVVINNLLFKIQPPPYIENLHIHKINYFDRRFDEFWTNHHKYNRIEVVRNKDYLNWRYSAPDANYSIFAAEKEQIIYGYTVLRHKVQNGRKISIIFDLTAESQEIMQCLIFRVIEECRHNDVDVIAYSSITGSIYHKALKKSGFIFLPFMKGEYFSAYSNSSSIPRALLYDSHSWLVQTGDSDAI